MWEYIDRITIKKLFVCFSVIEYVDKMMAHVIKFDKIIYKKYVRSE